MFQWGNRLMVPLRAAAMFIKRRMFDTSDYSKLPDTGFISCYRKTEDKGIPFVSHWGELPKAEVKESGEVVGRRYFLKPVTLDYFQDMPEDEEARLEVEQLRDYFENSLKEAFREMEQKTATTLLAEEPAPDVLTLEIALLCAHPAARIKNIILRAFSWLSTYLGPLTEIILCRPKDMGWAAMGVRFSEAGKTVCEIADFEYGLESVTGLMFFDMKSAQAYAYQRASIARWSKSLAAICSTKVKVPARRTIFTWKPY